MSIHFLLLQLIATAACAVVAWRAFCIVGHMNMANREQPYLSWAGFGMGYVLLATCAVGSAVAIWSDPIPLGYAAWPIASAMMIISDRRRRP